ncbi:MAG: hypothetical protein CM1200mP40_05070 [Gammaproteobacteria bacterium]|nr:MAG: hypothetical protein CM1200mP40_05070 [Gammaproteobacteria bacterium]
MVIKRGINRLLFLTGMLAVSAFAQQSETNSLPTRLTQITQFKSLRWSRRSPG